MPMKESRGCHFWDHKRMDWQLQKQGTKVLIMICDGVIDERECLLVETKVTDSSGRDGFYAVGLPFAVTWSFRVWRPSSPSPFFLG